MPFDIKIIQFSIIFVLPWKQIHALAFETFLQTSFPVHNSITVQDISMKLATHIKQEA